MLGYYERTNRARGISTKRNAHEFAANANFMQRKKAGRLYQSEPEFLISCMDRHKDWASLFAGRRRTGNHIGEAGIDAWLEAVNTTFPHWHIFLAATDDCCR